MIQRIWCAYTVEVMKAVRLKNSYVGPALVLATVLALALRTPIERDGVSDYAFIAQATPVALNIVGLFAVLTYCASLVSSELGSGTARLILVRPVRRHEFLAAKLVLGLTYTLVLAAITAVASWGLVLLRGELVGVTYGGELVHTGGSMARAYALGFLLSMAPLFATVAFATMLSTLSHSTGAAVGSAIGLWVALDVVKYPLGVAPYLFSSYLEQPWGVFRDYTDALDGEWFPMAYACVGASLAWSLLFAGVSFYAFSRRNLNA